MTSLLYFLSFWLSSAAFTRTPVSPPDNEGYRKNQRRLDAEGPERTVPDDLAESVTWISQELLEEACLTALIQKTNQI